MDRAMRRRRMAVLLLASLVLLLASMRAHANDEQLPNVVPLPPYDIRIDLADGEIYGDPDAKLALRFSVAIENTGAYALEMRAVGREPSEYLPGATRRGAAQCIRWVSRLCNETVPVGEFVWHEAHGHWHVADYALYELRRLDENGAPDMTEAGLVTTAHKVSFCLQDSKQADAPPPSDDPLTPVPLYPSCNEYVQGISPGWADVYDYGLDDQQIPVLGIPDGIYALVVRINPDRAIHQSNYMDDVAFAKLQIIEGGTQAGPI
jgi:hypothetical protein